jgi:hypothetical protein
MQFRKRDFIPKPAKKAGQISSIGASWTIAASLAGGNLDFFVTGRAFLTTDMKTLENVSMPQNNCRNKLNP